MPSIGDSGVPAFQRAVLASAAARAPVSFSDDERLHDRLARRDGFEAALQIRARRVGAVAKARGRVVEGQRLEFAGVVAARWFMLPPGISGSSAFTPPI